LIVAILFSTSIILFSLGIIGEYLSRIYQVQNRKPPYSIKKVLEVMPTVYSHSEENKDTGISDNENLKGK
jgi:hypothetical protein